MNEIILADVVRKASEPLAEYVYKPGKDNLQGMCGISSLALYKGLLEIKKPAQLKMGVHPYGIYHCWVETDKVIDVTATQFSRPEAVYITAPSKAKLFGSWVREPFNYHAFTIIEDWRTDFNKWAEMSPLFGKGKVAHDKIMEKVYSFLSAPA